MNTGKHKPYKERIYTQADFAELRFIKEGNETGTKMQFFFGELNLKPNEDDLFIALETGNDYYKWNRILKMLEREERRNKKHVVR